jgi:hypothetical protein
VYTIIAIVGTIHCFDFEECHYMHSAIIVDLGNIVIAAATTSIKLRTMIKITGLKE